MGVQGLWQLLNPTGRPVSLQSLEGKVLAVDVSIWLHQAVKGMRDRHGNPLPNAHLQVLFNRLCKLLYYRIKPVFVFDGGVPALKRQTMSERREKKEFAEVESDKATRNLVTNLLKSHAISEVMNSGENSKPKSSVPSTSKNSKPDLFELPPLPDEFKSIESESRRTEFTTQERLLLEDVDLEQIDIDSEVFNSLPAEMRHEVLTLLKEKKKRHTWNQILELPQESNDFSKFQMAKLMKQSKLSTRLADVTKEMNDKKSVDVTNFLGDDFYSDAIETRRIMSDDTAHSVLIKGLGAVEQKEELERVKQELEKKNIDLKEEKGYDEELTVENSCNLADVENVEHQQEIIELDNHEDKKNLNNKYNDPQEISPQRTERCTGSTYENKSVDIKVKDTSSERNDILKELQARMSALKDMNKDDDVVVTGSLQPFEETNGIHIVEQMEPSDNQNDAKCLNETNAPKVIKHLSEPDSRIITKNGSKPYDNKDKLTPDRDCSCEDDPGTNNSTAMLRDECSKLIDKESEISGLEPNVEIVKQTQVNNSSMLNPQVNLTSARMSILDELRQKVDVLSSGVTDVQDDDDEMETDNQKESQMKEFLTNNKKAFLRKQISLDEEQGAKRQETVQGNGLDVKDDAPAQGIPVSSDSDSEDEGFIEVTFDPERTEADEMFPADIFQPTSQSISPSVEETTQQSPNRIPSPVEGTPETSNEGSVMETMEYDDQDNYHHKDLVEQFKSLTEEEIRGYQENLEIESQDIQKERGKQERLASSITDQMYTEAQDLLELFGVPYIISPMEAEAQCAQLDLNDMTQGTITDDSDIWLFGGKRVYKNFFNQDKHVEFFTEVSIKAQLGIGRDILIKLALLCGSDYTPGIQSVGPITAMELLTEFPGEDLEGLRTFKVWWDEAQKQVTAPLEPKIKSKLRKLDVPEGFPSELVVKAYLNPEVDDSTETLTWGQPELDLIRDFTRSKFGWNQQKCDESMIPMLKQLNSRQTQTRINNFFQPESFIQPKNIKSKRLQRALNIIQGKEEAESTEPSGNLIKQSFSAPTDPNPTPTSRPLSTGMQQVKAMAMKMTRGKGRGRGRGRDRGRGKGKAIGQRSKAVVANEINLSEESSSESSGDELIANLDYDNIIGDSMCGGKEALNPSMSKAVSATVSGESKKPAKRSSRTTSKAKQSAEPIIPAPIRSNNVSISQNNNAGTESQGVPDSSQSQGQGQRTRPKIKIGKAGHASDLFGVDIPKEPQKGFLEDEVKSFDKVKKTRSKSQTVETAVTGKKQSTKRAPCYELISETAVVKKQKSDNSDRKDEQPRKVDKGKKLMKGNSPVKSSSKMLNKNKSESTDLKNEGKGNNSGLSFLTDGDSIDSGSILSNRRTRSGRIGTVNRVIVMSDSDSD